MKKYLFISLFFIFIMSNLLTAQVENYDKEDIVACLNLLIEHPDLQEAFERDINYQNEFDLTLRDNIIRYNPLRKLLQQVDDIDISRIDDRLYLERENKLRYNNNNVAQEEQRRQLTFTFQYDEVEDAFIVLTHTERQTQPRRIIFYSGNFKLIKQDEEWEIEHGEVLKNDRF